MERRIALVGNPNSGKTTLFNRLTGSNQYVGNWPGVTVEKKEGRYTGDDEASIIDLPGIYSLSPYTLEEVVARNYILDEKPDVIVDIVDGTNLERNLYLTDQLRELGIPMVVAVNMMDAVQKNGDRLDAKRLSEHLGCPVCEISALKDKGLEALVERATSKELAAPKAYAAYAPDIEEALDQIAEILPGEVEEAQKRWYAVKLFERDPQVEEKLDLDPTTRAMVEEVTTRCESANDDDAESLITSGRYDAIADIVSRCVERTHAGALTRSDKIDRVVTNRWLGLPIFVVVMFLVYFLSVTTVGTWATDWANDGVFGDGWFLGPGADAYEEVNGDFTAAADSVDAYEALAVEQGLDPETETFLADATAENLVATYDSYDADSGENAIVEVDAAAYGEAQALVAAGEPDPASYGIWVPGIPTLLEAGLAAIGCAAWLSDLLLNGIVAGVGAVLGFVPQMLVLFLLLAILESCGYMARIAFVLDRVFRRFGLSGKSFIPLLIATGCGVPGIMSSRTIENDRDRRMTVMTTTFIPCSAKLPIIALMAGAVFGGVWWVAPIAYFLGIAAVLCSGIILKKTKPFLGYSAPFVMELPAYHAPTPGAVLRSMWERASTFIKKAGTVILLATIAIWFLSGYGFADGGFGAVADQDDSLLALFAGAFSWIFAPLGWSQWQPVAATLTGLLAKENVVGTFGILYAGDMGWYAALQAAFTPLAGFSFLAFNLLCAPCIAAIGAMRREMNSPAWTWTAILYQCGIAYATALVIYQVGGLIAGEASFGLFSVLAFMLVAALVYLLFRPARTDEEDGEGVSSIVAAQEA